MFFTFFKLYKWYQVAQHTTYIPENLLSSHATKFSGDGLSVTSSLQRTWNDGNDFSLPSIFLAKKSNFIKMINLKNEVIVNFIIWNVKEFLLQTYILKYFEKCKQLFYEQIWLLFWLSNIYEIVLKVLGRKISIITCSSLLIGQFQMSLISCMGFVVCANCMCGSKSCISQVGV